LEAYSAPLDSLAGFERPILIRGGRGKEGREGDRRGENPAYPGIK